MAAIAVSRLPKAVMSTTGTSGQSAVTSVHSDVPLAPGMFWSTTRMSTSCVPMTRQGRGGRLPGQHSETAAIQLRRQQLAHGPIVVDDQHPALHAATSTGRTTGR